MGLSEIARAHCAARLPRLIRDVAEFPASSPARLRRAAQAALHATKKYSVEPLEGRVLLSGVTVITHGFVAVPDQDVSWMNTMANAISDRVGGADIWLLKLDGAGQFDGLSPISTSAGAVKSGKEIIEVDWTAAADFVSTGISTRRWADPHRSGD